MPGLIVTTGPITDECRDSLSVVAEVEELPDDNEEALLAAAPNAIGFVVRGTSRLTRKVIESAPGLLVIGRSGIGVDGVDMEAATERGIPVVVTPHAGVNAVAEGVFTLVLAITKKIRDLDFAVRNGNWADRDHLGIGDLDGATLGLVGLGRIGYRVATLASAFNMTVVAFDPYINSAPPEGPAIEFMSLNGLFECSDFISLHAPLTPETQGLVSADLLQSCKLGTVLVNLARGGLIESHDVLLSALDTGALAGIGLDVFDEEPPNLSHRIFQDERVLFSPHALGLSDRARHNIFSEMTSGMLAILSGERAPNIANPEIHQRTLS
jgi:phosphoglycerate dehydrogenase-like enzyme